MSSVVSRREQGWQGICCPELAKDHGSKSILGLRGKAWHKGTKEDGYYYLLAKNMHSTIYSIDNPSGTSGTHL
jgi:hypothetical protein